MEPGQKPRFREVSAPRDYRYPLEAIEAALGELQRVGDGWWCTIHNERATVQVAADCVNTLQEQVDLPAVSRAIGLSALADSMPPTRDPTLHRVPTASPGELAALVHGVFTRHFGLEDPYEVRCELEC